jgi:ferric enterobactin receptor
MKNTLLLFPFLLSVTFLFAQPPTGMGPGGPGRMQGAANGHLFGKVVDEKGEAVPFANVIVFQNRFDTLTKAPKDFILKGTKTENNGEFSLEDLPARGDLKVKIAFYGYENYEQVFSFTSQQTTITEKDLGKVQLKATPVKLDEVKVVATQSALQLDVDKKVFNVDQNTISAGGTAIDVLKNVPSVNVDIDGNVSMRNSSPQILLDGRPTTLTLDQIPADAIEKVEIITNPSAKYDASGGGGGILNVVLKKNRKTGYNGSVRAGASQYGEANLGGDFNVRQNKVNFSASINGRLNNGRNYGTVDRTNYLNGLPTTIIDQDNEDRMHGGRVFGKLGVDYLVTNKTTLSLSGTWMQGSYNPVSDLEIYTDTLHPSGTVTSFSQRSTDSKRTMQNAGLVFGLKHLFTTDGEELTFDANFSGSQNSFDAAYNTDYYTGGSGSTIDRSMLQKIEGSGSDMSLVVQTDYVKPFASKLKLETGLRAALRNRSTETNNFTYDALSGNYQLIYSPASNFKNDDQVYAAYATISKQLKTFGYKVGLRAESSQYHGTLTATQEKFSNSYPISLFPSIFLTQKFSGEQDLQLSYSRRINRPNFMQLIPFTDSTDKYNINRGNPALLPEFTQLLELSYMKRFLKNNSVLASLYYKYTNNLITRYIVQADNGALINTYINANSSYSTGLEVTMQNYITKWWDISTNVNVYNAKINTTLSEAASPDLWSWFAKLNMNFRLPANYSIQLSGMYQSKTNVPVSSSQGGGGGGGGGGGQGGPPNMQAQSASQGYIRSFYAVDFAIKKSFLKNKASLSLSVNDIFRSRYTRIYSENAYFTQDYSRINNPQAIRLNFSYTFGKLDTVLFKRKTAGIEDAGQ